MIFNKENTIFWLFVYSY